MNEAIVGAVLAGGRSRRMGRDKARLDIDGTPLAGRAAATLAAFFSDTVVVVGAGGEAADLGYRVICDRIAGAGPLAGLDSALSWAAGRPVFVLACDLPRVDGTVVASVVAAAGEAAVVGARAGAWIVARGSRLQPLCGLYTAACGPLAVAALGRGERSMHRFLERIETRAVALDDIDPDPLLNLNSPADHAALTAAAGPPR